MKRIFISVSIITIITVSVFGQKVPVTKTNLCKKWKLEKYEIFFIDYDIEPNEKNDYLYLKSNMTFESIDEGEFGTGTWSFINNKNERVLILNGKEGEIRLFIKELQKDRLILIIDDEELIDLKIHFVNK
jgi:hypothetical protein